MTITKNEEKEIEEFLLAGKSVNEATVKKVILENRELKEEIRKMRESIPGLQAIDAKILELENREARQKLNDSFIKKLADEKIPLSFARGHVIEKPEDIEKAFTEASNEYAAVKQELEI
jgi:hypothetical protein